MKKKKSIFIIIISVILLIVVGLILVKLLYKPNSLTVEERKWIDENNKVIQDFYIIRDANVFAKNGEGVFYDFFESLTDKYEIEINPWVYNSGEATNGITFGIKNEINENDTVFYEDHYVLISKTEEVITDFNNISNKKIGVLSSDLNYITKYLKNKNVELVAYDTKDLLLQSMNTPSEENAGEVVVMDSIIVPLFQYLDVILANNLNINYHFSDISNYYTMTTTNDILGSILKKHFNDWQEELETSLNKSEFKVFTTSLNLTEKEVIDVQKNVHNYGFVNTSPYEVIMGGKYGGIVAVYLSKFSALSDIEFNFVKYKDYNKFINAIEKGEISLYFNYYNFEDNFIKTDGPLINYSIVARRDNTKIINSIESLIGEEVYVKENSKLLQYIRNIAGIEVKTYKDNKELFALNKKDVYIILDQNIYNYYQNTKLDNYSERYNNTLNEKYEFKVKDNEILASLLKNYIKTLDYKELTVLGLDNHYETVKTGSIMSTIAKYIIYLVLIAIVIIVIVVQKSKKITIARKIKKDDKMKFIDQLTSLKNRNYLNENIESWNNNTIYPQTIIVIDLNKVQEINDTEGYNEGDRQIKAAANALIKTQLDNSEIMRTDGNEFVVYLVGYSQKQVSNYIHKLNKELNKLPYQYGAEFGYSMILDNIKTIEDAMNEAVEDMKKQKGSDESEKQSKK